MLPAGKLSLVIAGHPAPSPGELTAAVAIEVSDETVNAGSTVVVPGRVTNLTPDPVRVVLLAQGLAPSWCPPAQVLLLPEHHTAKVFLYLNPPVGTAPGRYRWALTAQLADHPLQAVTAELAICRPQAVRASTPRPRRRRRTWLIPLAVCAVMAAAAVVAGSALTGAGKAPGKLLPALIDTSGHTTEGPAGPSTAEQDPGPAKVGGTVFATGSAPDGRVRASVRQLSLDAISGRAEKVTKPGKTRYQVDIVGTSWTARLPSGLYALTFSKTGYASKSIVVATITGSRASLPPVQLLPLPAPGATSPEQEESGQHTAQQ